MMRGEACNVAGFALARKFSSSGLSAVFEAEGSETAVKKAIES